MDNTKFDVQGMSCQGCVASVTRVLKAMPGVAEVNVTLKPGTANVVYDPAQTNVQALKAAVQDAGYGVT